MAVVKIGSERNERPPILGTTTGEFSVLRQAFPLLTLAIPLPKNPPANSREPHHGELYREFEWLRRRRRRLADDLLSLIFALAAEMSPQ